MQLGLVMFPYSCLCMVMQDDMATLKQFMSEKKLTQMAAARALGVSQSSIQRVLAGKGVRTGPARRQMARALENIHNGKDGYSPSRDSKDLVEKLLRMCERGSDAVVLSALLDAVAAYRRRNGE